MSTILARLGNALAGVAEAFASVSVRRDTAPIDSGERVCHFAGSRAAFVTQKKLFGYLKERIGTRYPKMFKEPEFVQSIGIATREIYAASLADLTCFCVANAMAADTFLNAERDGLAWRSYCAGIDANSGDAPEHLREKWLETFDTRLGRTVWQMTGDGPGHFIESAPALIHWAPIAPELKRYDREIVENSIRYAWIEIRRDFLQRLDADAVETDWRAGASEVAPAHPRPDPAE